MRGKRADPLKRFTLDWNCVISLETGDQHAPCVRELVESHRQGLADVALLQTSASENMRDTKGFPGSYKLFEDRLRSVSIDDLPRIPTPGVYDLTFWDQCYHVDEAIYRLLVDKLRSIMAPNMADFVEKWSREKGEPTDEHFAGRDFARFRNSWCDVHSAYCHIYAQRDFLVTSNLRDFQKRGLADLGLVALNPEKAAALIRL